MKDKFTYFEFRMYLLPGTIFVGTIVIIISIHNGISSLGNQLDIFNSVVFILASFIFGHVLQAISHGGAEERLKKEYWSGLYPSQIVFSPDNPIVNEVMRRNFLNLCLEQSLLSQDDIENCNSKRQDPEIMEKIVNAFEVIWSGFHGTHLGERISIAEAQYQFFRGMFVSAFWSGILLIVTAVIFGGVSTRIPQLSFLGEPLDFEKMALLLLLGILSFVLWRLFRWRCRGAGQGFVREVVRAALSKRYRGEEIHE